jgi:hypothetical protein
MNIVQDLNSITFELFNKINKELNRNSIKFPERNNGGYRIPIISSYAKKENFTYLDKNLDAFALNPPVIDDIKDIIFLKDPRKAYVIRSVIGYQTAVNIINNPNEAEEILKPTIQYLINSLKKLLDFGPENLNCGTYGTFSRPGNQNDTFSELSDNNGFELRFYSDTFNCEPKEN